MQQKNRYIIFALFMQFIFMNSVYAITKCQDADGKWHYGDYATEECANSKLTKLNDQGVKVEEVAAPKSEEELEEEKARKEKEEAERLAAEKEEAEKNRILSIYETEEDIDRVRDNQLSSVQGNIEVHKAYIVSKQKSIERLTAKKGASKNPAIKKTLDEQIVEAQSEIENSKKSVEQFEAKKIEIVDTFKKEKDLYLELKAQ